MTSQFNINKLKISHWNANGLMHKWHELKIYIVEQDIDIMLINELKTPDNINYTLQGYNSLRKNRTGSSQGGGLLILIKNIIKYSEFRVNFNFKTLETIAIKLNNDITIHSVYVPRQNLDPDEIKAILSSARRCIAVGDFNAKHRSWFCKAANHNGKIINNLLNNNLCSIQAPEIPTLYPTNGGCASIVDFALVNGVNYTFDVNALNELDSDHHPIVIEINNTHNIKCNNKKFLIYKNANWNKFRKYITNNLTLNTKVSTTIDIDNTINNLISIINQAKEHSIPTAKPKTNVDLPDEIKQLIKIRNITRQRYQRTRNITHKIHKNHLSNLVKQEIKKYKNTQWHEKLKNLKVSDNSIWKTAKSFTKKLDNKIPTLHGPNGLVFDDQEKAEVLARNFELVHHLTENMGNNNTNIIVQQHIKTINNTTIDTKDIKLTSPKEIYNTIKKTKPKKAPGPDTIQNILLKNLSKKAIVQLTYIFNSCLKLSYFPENWKTANLLAFPKPGKDKLFPQNYRPISLLPTLSKIFEIIILNRIKEFENKNKIMVDEQFGFRQNRSTVQQLARITNYISNGFNINKSTAMLLLDIEKAFDTVWHQGLIYKLHNMNLPLYLTKIIQKYLTNRKFKVQVGDNASQEKIIVAGVPQGSILGPVLFSYYINDLPIDRKNSETALFADDTAIYNCSWNKKVAIDRIKITLDKFLEYYENWKIKINAAKTELIIFTHKIKKKKNENNLSIEVLNETIQPSLKAKYLGVTLDYKLKFSNHINITRNKAYAIKNLIHKLINKNSSLSIKNKTILYKALIKPILMYAAPIWSNTAITNLNKIKTFENKLLRYISNSEPNETNVQIKNKLDIISIEKDIFNRTKDFYEYNVKQHKILNNVGIYNKDNAPFKLKHKVPHNLLLS